MTAWRTVITSISGLVFLLVLALLAGWLKLDAAMVNGLALAGTGMVTGVAVKGSFEATAKARHGASAGKPG